MEQMHTSGMGELSGWTGIACIGDNSRIMGMTMLSCCENFLNGLVPYGAVIQFALYDKPDAIPLGDDVCSLVGPWWRGACLPSRLT